MQKLRGNILNVLKAVMAVGFTVQIFLGILWMLVNFTGFQQFGASFFYEEISQNLVCDEYEGILYPLLIRLFGRLEWLTGIPYYIWFYLLQLATAFAAAFCFLGNIGNMGTRWKTWASLAMLTFPFAMQCHLAILPESLLSSLLLFEVAAVAKMLRQKKERWMPELVRALFLWITASFMLPEYGWFGAIPVATGLLSVGGWIRKGRRKAILGFGMILIAVCAMVGINTITQIPGYYGKTRNSVSWILAKRVLWPRADLEYEQWPEEVSQVISWTDAYRLNFYPENLDENLGRRLEDVYGVEEAKELLLTMAVTTWKAHQDEVLHDVGWDMAGYAFPAPVVQLQMQGRGYSSATTRNIDTMRQRTLRLSKIYVDYGCWWFCIGLATAFWIRLLECGIRMRKKINLLFAECVLLGLFFVGYYTMQGAGQMDYKKTIFVSLLWTAWMMQKSVGGSGNSEIESEEA